MLNHNFVLHLCVSIPLIRWTLHWVICSVWLPVFPAGFQAGRRDIDNAGILPTASDVSRQRWKKKNARMKEIISPKKWMLHNPPAEKKNPPWSLECSADSSGPEGVRKNTMSPRAGLHRPVHGIKISHYIRSVEPTLKEHVERKSKALSCYSKVSSCVSSTIGLLERKRVTVFSKAHFDFYFQPATV